MAGAHPQAHVRVRRAEGPQDARQHIRGDRGCGCDDQHADVALLQIRDDLATLVGRRERPLGVREEGPAGVGELHAAARADEQLDPQARLK